jgi:hypothetical protein
VFLSPPWGGVEYKDSEYYSMRKMITPNILDIIRVCLTIAKKIIFYLPRTIMLEEFFEVLEEMINKSKFNKSFWGKNLIYVDIHILNSANKIKAVMLVFGNNINDVKLFKKYNTILNLGFTK